MTDRAGMRQSPKNLLQLSLERPFWMMMALYVAVYALKILDTFVLPFNEMFGELIVSKVLGFALVIVYVWACGRSLRDIGFHREGMWRSVLIGVVCIATLFALAYGVQLIVMRASGDEGRLVFSAVDPKTGLEGGLLFGLWMVAANFVNSAMEEGLFRGAMLRHFRRRSSLWGALLLQTVFFALWHLNWPVHHFLSGQSTAGEAAFEAAALLLSTGIAAMTYGYLYHKTSNLWGPFAAHVVNNSVLNIVFINTAQGQQSGTEFGLFLAIWLPGYLLLMLLIGWWVKRYNMPEVKPWGEFD